MVSGEQKANAASSMGLPEMSPLEWVELQTELDTSIKQHESFREKAIRRSLANPIAPIALIGTCIFLGKGLGALKRGDSKRQQHMMRGRVIAQIIGVSSIMAGLMLMRE